MNIKHVILIIAFLLVPGYGFAKKCEDCPASKPCKIVVPKGDKYNTCDIKVHCSDEFWYQLDKKCSFLDCSLFTPIENPFEQESAE